MLVRFILSKCRMAGSRTRISMPGAALLLPRDAALGNDAVLRTSNPLPVSGTPRKLQFSTEVRATPSYQVYGESAAFSVKALCPQFSSYGASVGVDSKNKGRLLLEWTQRNSSTGKFAWDRPIRFALSAEEAGLMMSKIDKLEMIELNRQTTPPKDGPGNDDFFHVGISMGSMQKVFRALPHPDGSAQFIVDYEVEGEGGREPPNENEARGPLEVHLMAGEYQVIKSIIEYSIPRLIGWVPMMDHALQNNFLGAVNRVGGTSYKGNRNSGGFFDDNGGSVPF